MRKCDMPEYRSWCGMKTRCYNSNNKYYESYGGRGIRICDRWLESFDNFYEDMGLRPTKKHSIDRIDNDGNYEPSNCRWATPKEQARNKRTTRKINDNGEVRLLAELSEQSGIYSETLLHRIERWGDVELAIKTPVNPYDATDLSGQKFNKLTVIKKFTKKLKSGRWKTYYECVCDCGNTTTVERDNLKLDHTKSCGCIKESDISGKEFGQWTVIKRTKDHIQKCGKPVVRYLCKCSCGTEKSVNKRTLINGQSKSCGCSKRKKNK